MDSYDADGWISRRNLNTKTAEAITTYAEQLNEELEQVKDTERVIAILLERFSPDELVMSTSFGIHSVVMLHLVYNSLSKLNRSSKTPVVWIDTGYLPPETYHYMQQLSDVFHLNLHTYQSKYSPAHMEAVYGRLWENDSIQAHHLYGQLRKVEPMSRALTNLNARVLLTGLRSNQTAHRSTLRMVNVQNGRLKICPLLHWTRDEMDEYIVKFNLLQHPLRAKGYETVGDWHSSRPVEISDSDERTTRFNGRAQECGLHLPVVVPQMQTITIYSKPTCKFCLMTKDLFQKVLSNAFLLNELTIGKDVDRETVQARVGNQAVVRTVPQIFIDHKYIGGYEEFKRWIDQGRIDTGINTQIIGD